MKKILTIIFVLFVCCRVTGQQNAINKQLVGEWQMINVHVKVYDQLTDAVLREKIVVSHDSLLKLPAVSPVNIVLDGSLFTMQMANHFYINGEYSIAADQLSFFRVQPGNDKLKSLVCFFSYELKDPESIFLVSNSFYKEKASGKAVKVQCTYQYARKNKGTNN